MAHEELPHRLLTPPLPPPSRKKKEKSHQRPISTNLNLLASPTHNPGREGCGQPNPSVGFIGCSIRIIQLRLTPCPELAAPLPQGKAEQPRVLLTLAAISRAESHEAGPYLLLEPAHGFLLPDPVLGSDVAGSALLVSDAETRPAQHLPGEQRHRVILALICFINTNSARKEAQSSQICNVSLSGSCSGHKASSSPPPT